MASLIEELQRREAVARHEVDELRGEIARLGERLARAEERLSRLEITRETVAEILGGVGTDQAAAGQEAQRERDQHRFRRGRDKSQALWRRAGTDASHGQPALRRQCARPTDLCWRRHAVDYCCGRGVLYSRAARHVRRPHYRSAIRVILRATLPRNNLARTCGPCRHLLAIT